MRSEYSITSADSGAAAASFEVLSNPLVKGLKFNDLLKAPAELLGKGKHGSVYKVVLDNGAAIAVKRTKDWGISCEDFSRRIKRIDKVKHPRVLNPLAFYCSDQEKLLVYEYQPNASLFMLLHGKGFSSSPSILFGGNEPKHRNPNSNLFFKSSRRRIFVYV
ncbi:unnamed protein product [Linum tenue]|nr:unnamed protein product [Linum tenue]